MKSVDTTEIIILLVFWVISAYLIITAPDSVAALLGIAAIVGIIFIVSQTAIILTKYIKYMRQKHFM